MEMHSVYQREKKFGLLKIIVRRDVTAQLECQELILTQQTENCYSSVTVIKASHKPKGLYTPNA